MDAATLHRPSQQLGRLLKAYREKVGRNQAEVAQKAGISPSMLSQIERGAVAPSIDTLHDVCATLGFDLADLFGRAYPRSPVRVHRAGERLSTRGDGVRYEQLVSSTDATHPAEMFLLEVEPGRRVGLSGGGHEGVEMGYVLAGTAVLTVEGTPYQIKRGDSVAFSSRLPHGLENASGSLFRAVWSALPPHQDYVSLDDWMGG